MTPFNLAICGAGPVGLTFALLLIQRGVKPEHIVLIDTKTSEQASEDKRSIALSYGSQQILQTIHAWPIKATEIHQIHISRRGHFGRTLIDRKEHHVPALGYVARYGDIIKTLTATLEHAALGITILRPATVSSIVQTANHAQIHLTNQRVVEAAVLVQAEGGVFDEQTPQTKRHDYQQTALVAHVKTNLPTAACAYERFTDQGPLALLPQEDGYALVWCMRPDQASHLMTLTDDTFSAQLQTAFGMRIGHFISSTARVSFALGLNAQTTAPNGRCIRIGNAAQTLHPVAGQGLNLGLRDAFQLAHYLSRSVEPESLHDFFQARQSDRHTTIQLTHLMAQFFSSTPDGSLKQALSGTALCWLDLCAPARHWLATQMMFGRRSC